MKKKLLSILLTMGIVLSMLPMSVFATESQTMIGESSAGSVVDTVDGGACAVCENHKEHTTGEGGCGYLEAVAENPCNHSHNESCGYAPAIEGTAAKDEVPCDKGCTDTDGDGAVNHIEGCAYTPAVEEVLAVQAVPCNHQHDEACGYVPAVEGKACTHQCEPSEPMQEEPARLGLTRNATYYDVRVAGIDVTSENKDAITGEGIEGTVTYDPDTNTLTLDNATIFSEVNPAFVNEVGEIFVYGIYSLNTLNIVLVGTNSVTNGSDESLTVYSSVGIAAEQDLHISGSGSLTVKSGQGRSSIAILARGTSTPSTIADVQVTAIGSDRAGNSTGISATGSITIENSTITAQGGNDCTTGSYGLKANQGCTVKSGIVTAGGGTAPTSKALNQTSLDLTSYTAPKAAVLVGDSKAAATAWDNSTALNTYKYVEIAPDYGDFSVTMVEGNTEPTFEDGVLTFAAAGKYTVGMKSGVTSTTDHIAVTSTANITLNGVNIDVSEFEGMAAFKMTSTAGAVTLTLADGSTNTLKSGGQCAGLQNDTTAAGTMLTINGGTLGTGVLTATGGNSAAGIGGGAMNGSNITIGGGTVIATGGNSAAGIGGGVRGTGSSITITGGTVIATGSQDGAGIGLSSMGGTSNITISGGTVTAQGGSFGGEGIGLSAMGGTSNIAINGGTIMAQGGLDARDIGETLTNGQSTAANVELYTLTVTDGTNPVKDTAVSALTATNALGYAYGMKDVKTDRDGKLYVYLPADKTAVSVTVDGNTYSGDVTRNEATLKKALPTAAQYAAAAPAAAEGTDYVVDTSHNPRTLTIKTDKGAAHFSASGTTYLDYNVTLANDIDVSAFSWTPVGGFNRPFLGIFDGQNHTLSGLTVSTMNEIFAGVFGVVGSGSNTTATVKNLAVCGSVNVSYSGDGTPSVGGIAGYCYGTIDNCTNNATITLNTSGMDVESRVGGIVGYYNGNALRNSHNTGAITATSTSMAYAGGIVGVSNPNRTVANCYNTGKVFASGGSVSNVAGGIVGLGKNGLTIKNCYSTGIVSAGGARAKAGGICGSNNGSLVSIANCYLLGTSATTILGETQTTGITGCGTIGADKSTLTAGTAANCGSAQTLAHGAVLLGALNGGVNAAATTDYATWAADDATTPANGGYPVLGSALAVSPHTHCVCGDTANIGNHTDHSTALSYTPFTGTGGSLSAGNYYLTGDVTLTQSIVLADDSTVNFCLNGYKIDANGQDFDIFTDNGTLNLCDCKDSGKLTGVSSQSGDVAIRISRNSTLNLYGGSITQNSTYAVNNYKGVFNMYGGSITGNTGTAIGGVNNVGAFTMYGGSITNNTGGKVGGVLYQDGSFTLCGNVDISGNKAGEADSNVVILFSSVPENDMPMCYIELGGALSATTPIGVTISDLTEDGEDAILTPVSGIFTTGTTVANNTFAGQFKSDNSAFEIAARDAQLELKTAPSDTTAPTLVSASRTNDTTLVLTFSEDLSAVDPSKFIVKETGGFLPYEVSAATIGTTNAKEVTLTVRNVNAARLNGLTITLAAGAAKDQAATPNVSAADTTGKRIAAWSDRITDAKLIEAQNAIMAAINKMSRSNDTTGEDILNLARAASLHGVTVDWDENGVVKKLATDSAKGFIRGTLKLTLNGEHKGIGLDMSIAKLPAGGGSTGGIPTPPPVNPPVVNPPAKPSVIKNTAVATGGAEDDLPTDDSVDTKESAPDKSTAQSNQADEAKTPAAAAEQQPSMPLFIGMIGMLAAGIIGFVFVLLKKRKNEENAE